MISTSRGGSAAGPKPGRASFYRELGRYKFVAGFLQKRDSVTYCR
jgi:hypothetical protein